MSSNNELIKLVNDLSDRINRIRPTERSFARPEWFDPVFGGKLYGSLFAEGGRFHHFSELMEDKAEYTIGRNNGDDDYDELLQRLANSLNQVHVEVNATSDNIMEYCRYLADLLSSTTLDDSIKITVRNVINKIAYRAEIYNDVLSLCTNLGCDVCNGTIHHNILTACLYTVNDQPNARHRSMYFEICDWVAEFKRAADIPDDEEVD